MCDASGRGSVTTSMIRIIIEAFAAARGREAYMYLWRGSRGSGLPAKSFAAGAGALLHMVSQQRQPPTEKLLVPDRLYRPVPPHIAA